jgi:signal transduction histidine kinase
LPACLPAPDQAIGPVKALAAKLGRMLDNVALTERLVRVEKLAGLGQLAGGVAHELNNPLTAVLGFAELIAETSAEARVRDDAGMIVTEALRMREIVQNLVDFWRPAVRLDQTVELGTLLNEIVAACAATLRQRGIELVAVVADSVPPVRGNIQRLRVVMEHLLNNAAQSIQKGGPQAKDAPPDLGLQLMQHDDADQAPAIRVTLSHAGNTVNLVVSDTGPGFRDPARVFDAFYTTRQPGEGTGLGLSICYGIVHEHGGEISAFNLHPHGAAVVIELPVRQVVAGEDEAAGGHAALLFEPTHAEPTHARS